MFVLRIGLELVINLILDECAEYFHDYYYYIIILIYEMSESSEQSPSQFPRTQSDIFRCIVLSN